MKFLESDGIKQLLRRVFFWSKKTFIGTRAEWVALTEDEKNSYDIAQITDDCPYIEPADVVESGNMNPVTSNAVANILNPSQYETIALTPDIADVNALSWTVPSDGVWCIAFSKRPRVLTYLYINDAFVGTWRRPDTFAGTNSEETHIEYFRLSAGDVVKVSAGTIDTVYKLK